MLTSSTCGDLVKKVLPFFAEAGVPVAFLVLTETGFKKSIMDAVAPLRSLLYNAGLHDYATQNQGQDYKKIIPSHIVVGNEVYSSKASLYRPVTKQGDPRIWFTDLKKYCKPNDLLAIITIKEELYVFNMNTCLIPTYSSVILPSTGIQESNGSLWALTKTALQILNDAVDVGGSIARELFNRIKDISRQGFIPAVKHGDTAVGMTLEHCLGIAPNDSKLPDYKGIELKASRVGENEKQRNRVTLFTQVPDWKASKMTEALLLKRYGYMGKDKNGNSRWNLYCTLSNIPNPQGLYLVNDVKKDLLINYFTDGKSDTHAVVQWSLEKLRRRTLEKHRETFWVKAESKIIDGVEYFKYNTIVHTKNPNASLFGELAGNGDITLDYAVHLKADGVGTRNHGYLFKMRPGSLNLMFPEPKVHKL